MIKVLVVAGTRPEIIKIAPLSILAKKEFSDSIDLKFCFAGQHKTMAEEAIEIFNLHCDFNLDIMKQNQSLNDIAKSVLEKLPEVLKQFKPDILLVQGDTTTAIISAMCAFNMKIPVGHIEAGLRSFNLDAPFPEEANRKIINTFSKLNFAPTNSAKNNLLNENINEKNIYLVGNTIIDALEIISEKYNLDNLNSTIENINKPFVLITAHRRESFGDGFKNICEAILDCAINHPTFEFVYPVHLNPNVREPVMNLLSNQKNIKLIEPVSYLKLLTLLKNCEFVLTDSGGIQEEAPSFNKFCIVMRDVTERVESIENGFAKLVGSDKEKIIAVVNERIKTDKTIDIKGNPYGDGKTSERILTIIENYFN